MPTRPLIAAIVLLVASIVRGEVRLAPVFGDGAVLQRGEDAAVFGTAAPGATLTVRRGDATASATADARGRWRATFADLPADATPRDLVVEGDGTARSRDVVVGDVWLCAGQSNMGWRLDNAEGAVDAIAQSADPLHRHFDVRAEGRATPADAADGAWLAASPETAGGFSAVAYFFARDLRREVGVPIGVLHASVGGTPIEAWSRRASLDALDELRPALAEADRKVAATQAVGNVLRKSSPGWLFNGFLAPLVDVRVRGFAWYQGESNEHNAGQYRRLLATMIADWRGLWRMPDAPFLVVQIASRETARDDLQAAPIATLRAQQAAVATMPSVAVVPAIDTRARDWHPLDKRPVGERLARAALNLAYGRKDVDYRGPRPIGFDAGDGKISILFENTAGGLLAAGDAPTGFTIAGADGVFVPATATIVGPDRIEVRGVPSPRHVRYGWSRGPHCNVYNGNHLPLAPFRTDD